MDINRRAAYNTLFEIEKNGAYSNIELNNQINKLKPDSPAFVRELVYGVLENRMYLDYILEFLIPKGLRGVKKQDLTILRIGIYQMIFMNSVPLYAAVNESVKMAKKFCRGRDGFINGVLRGYEKKKNMIKLPGEDREDLYLSIKYSYDVWIVKLWLEAYGREKTESLLKAGNLTPMISLRANKNKITREQLMELLRSKGIEVEPGKLSDNVILAKGAAILDLEEYAKGMFSVQDEASVLDIEVLNPKPGDVALDICAAPGGKTLAMAEFMGNKGRVYAFDVYEHKLKFIDRDAKRLGLSIIKTGQNDGQILNHEYIDKGDCVLVDGPCSGLGVIRKKPEIKYKKIEDKGKNLADKQLQILDVSSNYVKAGGTLVYSTCTINKIENEDVTDRFLEAHKEFQKVYQRQFFPHTDFTDGFYICKMTKV